MSDSKARVTKETGDMREAGDTKETRDQREREKNHGHDRISECRHLLFFAFARISFWAGQA